LRRIGLGVALIAAIGASGPAFGKTDRVDEVAEATQICSLQSSDEQIGTALAAAKWKDVTPVMFGQSMAEITGAMQYRKSRDSALISTIKSPAGRNCQFDFSNISSELTANIVRKFDEIFGMHKSEVSGALVWNRERNSYSILSRTPEHLTILWLPEQAQKAAQQ